jgi:hypothetical protein
LRTHACGHAPRRSNDGAAAVSADVAMVRNESMVFLSKGAVYLTTRREFQPNNPDEQD